MKGRNAIVGIATLAAAVGSFALPTVAAAKTNATTVAVNIKMVVPSKVNNQGNFELQVIGSGTTFKSFDLWRKATNIGSSFVKIKSKVNGTSYIDTDQDSFGEVTYGIVPWSGKNDTGTKGAEGYSVAFYPASETYGGNTSFCYASSGTSYNLTGTKWYGHEALETVGPATVWCFPYYYSYNDGVIIGVGPGGGTAEVYVNGSGKGTSMNFDSSTTNGFTEGYKHGAGTPEASSYEIVTTGSGDMWFTGMVQTASSIA